MSLRPLAGPDAQERRRGDAAVCIVAGGPPAAVRSMLESVLAHTDSGVPIVLVSPSSEAAEVTRALDAGGGRSVLAVEAAATVEAGPGGTVAALNQALDQLAPADVAVLTEPCLVADEWLDRIRAAAASDSGAASASALSEPGPGAFEARARRVRERSLQLRPRLTGLRGPCVYLRRAALELVGPLDETLAPTLALEADFAARCTLRGLSHVAADDVLTARLSPPRPQDAPAPAPSTGDDEHAGERTDQAAIVLRDRYPQFAGPPPAEPSPTLERALAAVRPEDEPISATIDARALGPSLTGTQVHILELICALARTGRVRARVVVAGDLAPEARARLEDLSAVTALVIDDIDERTPATDIVHRPQQVFAPADLDLLVALGRRMVVSQLDLIAYRNPGYFPDRAAWARYQRLTRQALAAADRVVVSSGHTLADLVADELVETERVRVIPPGLDHAPLTNPAPPRKPAAVDGAYAAVDGAPAAADGAPFLLCLGTDFQHKNRLFALALLRELRERHGWDGRLLLAGTHVPDGSSSTQETEFLADHAELAGRVLDLGPLDPSERDWLMAHAAALVYPSVYEGFGLVPFEAADAGVPCLFAPQTSLREVLPEETAALVPWNPVLSADAALPLLTDGDARERHVRRVREAGRRLTWEAAAHRMVEVYREALVGPSRGMLGVSRDQARREHEIDRMRAEHVRRVTELEHEAEHARRLYWGLREQAGDGLSLIGPNGSLPEEVQRALLALSARPALGRRLYGGAAALYRIAHRAYRRAR